MYASFRDVLVDVEKERDSAPDSVSTSEVDVEVVTVMLSVWDSRSSDEYWRLSLVALESCMPWVVEVEVERDVTP